MIDYYLTALLAQGHILVEDVPGTGKTKLSKAFAISMGMDFSRLQFTADMLPADITGLRFYNSKEVDFRIRKGPIFSNIVLADEINRATPKAQSALLALLSAAKANAYINGKTSCSIDDVKNIAVPVFAHRIKLKPKNLTGQLKSEEVINNIVWN